MSSGSLPRTNMPMFGNFGNALLERGNPGIRRSTPDSEALASSDEEVESSRLRTSNQRKTLQNRRSSLLPDPPSENRRGSASTGNQFNGLGGSQPNTPGIGSDLWSSMSPNPGANWSNATNMTPFGSSIWGSRDPPARLQEVSAGMESQIPFPIPPQPNPGNYRSMSFSVGQSEFGGASSTATDSNRARPGQPQRRSSKLGSHLSDAPGLVRVNELEDEDLLRQSNILLSQRMTEPPSDTSSLHHFGSVQNAAAHRSYRPRGPVVEEVIDDNDEPAPQARYPIRNAPIRRFSDLHTAVSSRSSNVPTSSAGFSTSRRPQWSTDSDFGQLGTIPQSRRHSFADVPTRHGSIGSNDDRTASFDGGSQGRSQEHDSQAYYEHNDMSRLIAEREVQQKLQREQQSLFGSLTYSPSANAGAYHGPSTMPLYIVNFKCCRSDVFFIQEGTGLEVHSGELVIVEADRGTDLGTVQHAKVSWEEARKFKAYYAEEHYKWLMMFSQQSRSGGPNLVNPNSPSGRGGASGGGSQGPGHRDADIKPKMIKRVAQKHEVQALQEKEGNEARAKRVCQQKVSDHGLNMEILDAEFQMDSKKLTFYYFADEYINFNSLVTDLFKIYKTRIWMSAINPASFVTPTASLGLTPAYAGMAYGAPANQYPLGGGQFDERDHSRPGQQPRQGVPNHYFNPSYHASGMTGPPGFSNNVHPATDPFSGHASLGYNQFASRPPNFGYGRQDSHPRSGPQSSANAMAAQFQSMSLGRYEPTTSV